MSLGIALIMQNRKSERKHTYEGKGEKNLETKKEIYSLHSKKKKIQKKRTKIWLSDAFWVVILWVYNLVLLISTGPSIFIKMCFAIEIEENIFFKSL